MSIFSKIGKVIGKVGKVAAPILGLTGVGLPLAAAIGGGSQLIGKLSEGGNVGQALGAGLGGAALGAGGALAGKAINPGGGVKNLIGRVGDFVTKDPLRAAELGLAGASAIKGAQQTGQANALRGDVGAALAAEAADKAALRKALIERIGRPAPQRESLAGVYGGSNPFRKAV